jgi:hypothetical protein
VVHPRTQSRVMYFPPQPPALVPNAARVLVSSVAYPVRRDQHYDMAVSLKIHRLFLMVLYIIAFTNIFLQFDVVADLSRIIEESKVRLNLISHQEIEETFHRMGAITTRFLSAVNYRVNPALPLFPRYPQSSSNSTSTGRSHTPPSSSSRPPYQAAFYPARPPTHPPWRMSPLGGAFSQRSCTYTCTSTRRARTGTTGTCTWTSTSTRSSSTSSSTGSFLVHWRCSSVQ